MQLLPLNTVYGLYILCSPLHIFGNHLFINYILEIGKIMCNVKIIKDFFLSILISPHVPPYNFNYCSSPWDEILWGKVGGGLSPTLYVIRPREAIRPLLIGTKAYLRLCTSLPPPSLKGATGGSYLPTQEGMESGYTAKAASAMLVHSVVS